MVRGYDSDAYQRALDAQQQRRLERLPTHKVTVDDIRADALELSRRCRRLVAPERSTASRSSTRRERRDAAAPLPLDPRASGGGGGRPGKVLAGLLDAS
jgi:hypothetical protein